MSFNRYADDYEEGAIDADGDGTIRDLHEEEKKEERARRTGIKANIALLRETYQLPKLDAKQMNWNVKHYQMLLARGWTDEAIAREFINTVESDLWKEKMQNGEYPGMNTVEFTLRNKVPKKSK